MLQNPLRRIIRAIAVTAGMAAYSLLGLAGYLEHTMAETFYVNPGEELVFANQKMVVSQPQQGYERIAAANESHAAGWTVDLKLFGVIPIKSAHVSRVETQLVTPGGTPFGIKLFTKGVLVIDVSSIETASGSICPAEAANIKKGDIIESVAGKAITSNEEIGEIIAQSGGNPVNIRYIRGGQTLQTKLTPVASKSDGIYRGGIWVRDSSAGIGTITYYDQASGNFAGLGHGICDTDTGEIMPLSNGDVCPVKINSVKRGEIGSPGELRGSFTSNTPIGSLTLNNEAGIYGSLEEAPNQLDPVPIKLKQEVCTGPATILCTLSSGKLEEYDILIEKVDLNPRTMTKNMMIRVTDEELLAQTGGIVQGMSGSPILQDGKLVGAVTHVFVNSPTKGYGIFIENMLNYSNKLGKAS